MTNGTTLPSSTSSTFSTANTTYSELQWGTSAPPLDGEGSTTTTTTPTPPSNKTTSIPVLPFHSSSTALLVVDVQPEYWSQCESVRRDFEHFPSCLQQTVAAVRSRCPPSHIIWVRADYRYSHSPWLKQFARLHGLEQQQQQQEEQQQPDNTNNNNTFRTEIPYEASSSSSPFSWEPFAQPRTGEFILPKTSWSSTSNTALLDHLQNTLGVQTVLVCGLITSVCVQHSAFGLFEAGYRTVLVGDACADRGRHRHEAALALYGGYMYELVTSGQLQDEHRWIMTTDDDQRKEGNENGTTTTSILLERSLSSHKENYSYVQPSNPQVSCRMWVVGKNEHKLGSSEEEKVEDAVVSV